MARKKNNEKTKIYIYEKQSKCSVKYIPYYYKRLSSPPLKNRLPRAIYKENYKTKYLRLFTPFPNLITKESYNWWVTRRFWGFRQQISKAKYLWMSVGNIRKLQENNTTLYTERKTLLLSIIRRSGNVYLEKLKRPSLPFGFEISGCKMSVAHIEKLQENTATLCKMDVKLSG